VGLPYEDRPVAYPPVLTTLAKDHETNWREAAHAEVVRARDALADRSTFSGPPAARAFGSVYAAAATEYTETLRGIQDDLVTAAQNLALAAAEMRGRDENAGDAFVRLLARWTDPAGFESVRRREESKGSETVVEGSSTLNDLDLQRRHDGTPLSTPDSPTGDGSVPGDAATGAAPTPAADPGGAPTPAAVLGAPPTPAAVLGGTPTGGEG
jgi:hypothetical protein